MRRTTALSWIAGAGLAGLVAGRVGLAVPAGTAAAAIVVLAALTLVRRRWWVWTAMVLAAGLGCWRGAASLAEQARLTNLIGTSVVLVGMVTDDPATDPRGFMDFKIDHLQRDGHSLPGSVQIHMYPVNMHRGYRVQADGAVRSGYGNVAVELSYPRLTILSTHQSWLERVRQRFFVGMRTALPEPLASFGLGLLVGVRALIPKPLQAQLALVGLSHLVAVSGYNLTIIVVAVQRLLRRWGRGIALVASLWLMGVFLVVTGASASIVRASLVAVLALGATFYGRRFAPVLLILLSAALTAAYRPSYLTDLGWLLSFLAFFGIMVLAPALEARFGHPKRLAAKLLLETSAAQLMTLPLLLSVFGQLSIVAPLTNVLELPLVPLAMLLSCVAGVGGMLAPAFAGWLAWPASLLLQFMLALIDFCARWPLASVTFYIDAVTMVGLYGLICLMVLILRRANRRHGRPEPGERLLEVA